MSNWICLDASLLVRFLLELTQASPLAVLWQSWHQSGRVLVAPTLLYYEIGNALHRYVMHGDLSPEQGVQSMEIALEMNVSLFSDADLHRRAMEMAVRFRLPAVYDAHYLALAQRLGAELWTADRRLHHAVGNALPWVHLL